MIFVKKIKFTNKRMIGLPMTPSNWVDEPQYEKISVIEMTSGGGMGGRHWHEYVERIDEIPPNTIIPLKRIGGDGSYVENVKVNTNYIVSVENCTLVTIHLDSQNPNHRRGIWVYKCLVDDEHAIQLINSFDSDSSEILTSWG